MNPTSPSPTRTRTVAALFGGVGLSTAAFIAMVTIAPLVAEDLLGSPRWSGLPLTAAIIGGAIGTTVLASIMARRGRYDGLLIGYAIASVASAVAGVAIVLGSLWLFITAMFFAGAGVGANRLARYANAELYPPERRASSISWMVWGGTIGSVAGPSLLEPSRSLAVSLSLIGEAGPFILGTTAIILSAVLLLVLGNRPLLTQVSERPEPAHRAARELLRIPRVRLALIAMVVGQLVMVLIMTMTPIHIRAAGYGLSSIGLVISAHTLGMYALSPLTGLLSDRFGRIPIILIGDGMLIVAGLMSATAGTSQTMLVLALFLLGLGWNFGFVSGSALLTENSPADIRIQLQGVSDSVIWGTGALASLSSGVLFAGWGYPTLSLAGAVIAVVPVVAFWRGGNKAEVPGGEEAPR